MSIEKYYEFAKLRASATYARNLFAIDLQSIKNFQFSMDY